ncbi:RNA-guided endonuclease InsQ/TnpB family protein [Ferrimicrobium acidiphilum]|uniref:RNA-guided endonuclease InsQ/TnpB family protein n=1 Tax=Ferrimicrobium acidiphilum TaxID=121039 RepID=UPI0023F3EAD0|nr:transposase [Ferrimicrobium acidiphilum]
MLISSAGYKLLRYCADSRYVRNLGLEQRNLWVKGRSQRVTFNTQAHELTEARKETWLGEGSSPIQQQALRDLDRAFQNWWRRPDHFGRPTWRKAGQHEGFYIRDLSVRRLNRKWGQVYVPKCGWVKFRVTRKWSEIETASSARVTRDRAGRWFVSFTRPAPQMERRSTGTVVGLDMGVTHTAAMSDGQFLDMSELLSKGEKQRKRRLQRKLARQTKGSNRKSRTKLAIAKISTREKDRRKDWIEKTTIDLVRSYDLIVLEDLKIKNMTKSAKGTVESPGKNVRQKAGLNRSILAQSWGLFRKRLTDKATNATVPVEIITINPAYTSLRCSECGHTDKENRKSQAVFCCKACDYTGNADLNAAKNILAAEHAVSGRGGTSQAKPDRVKHSDPTKRQPARAA